MSAPVRVSVVMPFLESERFIREAVESVLAQSFPHWELLLVDDGSTDGSAAIADGYAALHPGRIRVLHHPGRGNRGASAARNLALREARGDLVAFLDADDVWLPDKLAEQVALMDARPEVGALYGNTLFWHGWTGSEEDASRDHLPDLGVPAGTTLAPPELLVRCLRGRAAVPCTCSIVLRREVVERVGGFEESFRRVFTDQAFYAKVFAETPVYVADRCWDRYRIHPESSCSTAEREGRLREARAAYLAWVAEYLDARGIADDGLRRAVRSELWLHRHPRVAGGLTAARRGLRGLRQRVGNAGRALLDGRGPALRLAVRRRLRPLGGARFGNLRRVAPVSRAFGYDRGSPVDRRYIEAFLAENAPDIRGRVLEVGDDAYTRRFGGGRVEVADVLHVHEANPKATIVDDLSTGQRIPSGAFDCVVLTQTLHLIYDVGAAARTLHRVLKPGGVLLATVPGISQVDRGEWGDTWYWAFTPASARRLFRDAFPDGDVQVEAHGNVLAATAFLYGLAAEELRRGELDHHDPQYPLVVTVRARKAAEAP